MYLNANALWFEWHRNRKEGDTRKISRKKNKRIRENRFHTEHVLNIQTTTNTNVLHSNQHMTISHHENEQKKPFNGMEYMLQFTFITFFIFVASGLCYEWTIEIGISCCCWHWTTHNGFIVFDGFWMFVLVQTEDD